jgi:hypothetical protein
MKMATCEFRGKIINATRWVLVQTGYDGDSMDPQPAEMLQPNSETTFRTGGSTGTQGDLTYAMPGDPPRTEIQVNWYVPLAGSNHFNKHVRPPGALRIDQTGNDSGWSPDVVWTILPPG